MGDNGAMPIDWSEVYQSLLDQDKKVLDGLTPLVQKLQTVQNEELFMIGSLIQLQVMAQLNTNDILTWMLLSFATMEVENDR